jgi:hypothetical protein
VWVLVAVAMAAVAPASAQAKTYCVGLSAEDCHSRHSASAAFAAAAASSGPDMIMLGELSEREHVADAPGEPVRVVGSGRGYTELAGGLDLDEKASSVAGLSVDERLELVGRGRDLAVRGGVDLRGGVLQSAVVDGRVAASGAARMESVLVRDDAGVAVQRGDLAGRHLTVVGSGLVGVRAGVGGSATLADSIVARFHAPVQGPVTARDSRLRGDPGFRAPPDDLRLRADSPLIDAGDPAPLAPQEPQEDARGHVRAVDGDGDGTARRDVGALERRPPRRRPPSGNVLANPGAELGRAATDDTSSFAPPGWRRRGDFTSVRYGTVGGGDAPFPTLAAAHELGAGRAFFAGGPGGAASARQVVDVSRLAPEIDSRHGAVRLSALLGGYRASPDRAIVRAKFRGPSGGATGVLALDGVTPAERANATMLTARAASMRIPPLTRTIAVTVRTRVPSGRYNDAYADDIALVPRYTPVRGIPTAGRPPARSRPFAGVALLRSWASVDSKGRAWLRIGCASRTVGRCSGVLTIARRPRAVIGSKRFRLRPGRRARIAVPLTRHARRLLRRHGHVKARLHSASRDRQGLTRTMIAPLRIDLRR